MKPRPERCDVAVVGAGTSGVVAALAAARRGARVALVEATGRIGGMAIHGLHRFVCGLFCAGGDRPGDFLHGDTTLDFCRHLAGGDPAANAVRRGRVWLLPFAGGQALETCAGELLSRESNIRLHLRDPAVRAARAGDRLEEIELASGLVLKPGAAIDCTGTADLCRLAGGAVERPVAPAMAGYGFEVRGIQAPKADPMGLSIAVPLRLRREVEAGRLAAHLAFTTWEPGHEPGSGWVKLAVPVQSLARARDDAEAVWAVLKNDPAFGRGEIVRYLPAPLSRETGHLVGNYVLTGEDVRTARKFPDGIARNAWPLEQWTEDAGVVFRYLPDGEWHDVPRRCLQPKTGPENLLCAGAAISADSAAAASIRVMGVCMALGEAAARLSLDFP